MSSIKFGFCVPIFANPGMILFRTPAYKKLDWKSIKDTVLFCEKMGYDSIFIADHAFLGRNGEIWECVSLMSAFAAITKKMHIAPIHLCNNLPATWPHGLDFEIFSFESINQTIYFARFEGV